MPYSRKYKKFTNKRKKTRKRVVKKQKGGINLPNPLKRKQNPIKTTNAVPNVSEEKKNVNQPLDEKKEEVNIAPNTESKEDVNIAPNTESKEDVNNDPNTESKEDVNNAPNTESKEDVNDGSDIDSEDDDSDSDDDNDDEVDESMKIIEQFLETDCNNVVLKDLMFIAKDINKILLEILPLFDEELVDIIIIFLANFNKKFAEDEDFRNQLNIAIENVINTIVNSGMDAFGSGCGVIIKLLTTMAQGIPGVGAVISSLMIANNIADTGTLISDSGKKISKASDDFTGKMSELMGKINDTMPKIDNSKFNFKDVLEKKRQEARMLKAEKKKKKEKKEKKNKSDPNLEQITEPKQPQPQQ